MTILAGRSILYFGVLHRAPILMNRMTMANMAETQCIFIRLHLVKCRHAACN